MDTNTIGSVAPLFMKGKDINNPNISALDICKAVAAVIGSSNLIGVQNIKNLWRIYPKTVISKVQLFTKQTLLLDGKHINLYEQNPFASRQADPRKPNDKLTMKNVPISVSNEEFVKMLEDNGVELQSKVQYSYLREVDGSLTSYWGGDRFVYVTPFDPPLPHNQTVANFPCTVIHHGKTFSCKSCGQAGHKTGDETCIAKPKEDVYSFRGYTHPLSNYYPFQFRMYEYNFNSVEQAFYWQMATEMGKHDVATQIKDCKHAGQVYYKRKDIASDEERWRWEEDHTDVMRELLQEKSKQCEAFRNCLIENEGKVLAEATGNKLWATGLSPYITSKTAPDYWPGKNLLGALLMELTQEILTSGDDLQNNDDEDDDDGEQSDDDEDEQSNMENQHEEPNASEHHLQPQEEQHQGKLECQAEQSQEQCVQQNDRKPSPKQGRNNSKKHHTKGAVGDQGLRGRTGKKLPPSKRSISTPSHQRRSENKAESHTPDIRLSFKAKRKDLDSTPPENNVSKHAKTGDKVS